MKKKIYICGPISNMPGLNREEFSAAAAMLRLKEGVSTVNPFDLTEGLDLDPYKDYEAIMRIVVREMLVCDEVVTLKGWENSEGAKREVNIARLMKMPVVDVVKYLPQGVLIP